VSREWKPGDVVTATVMGRPNVRLVAGWSRYDPRLRWCELSPRWADGDDDECWFMPSQVTDARPLVVIDPEDREQVNRLDIALASMHFSAANCGSFGVLRAALRSLVEPPKPEEPKGLGAVVEDAEGARWIRTDSDEPAWSEWENAIGRWHYDRIAAVRVLSEGIQ
jgi:hypothetical protein